MSNSITENRQCLAVLVVGAVLCSIIINFTIYATARIEFTYAMWTYYDRKGVPLPPIAAVFRNFYQWVWVLPVMSGGIGISAVIGKLGKVALACWISMLSVAHLLCLFFWMLAFYLVDQSFCIGK